jgi:hypothetical protein
LIGFIVCLFVFEPIFTGGILIAVGSIVLYLGAQSAWIAIHNNETHIAWRITNFILFILVGGALFFSLSRSKTSYTNFASTSIMLVYIEVIILLLVSAIIARETASS